MDPPDQRVTNAALAGLLDMRWPVFILLAGCGAVKSPDLPDASTSSDAANSVDAAPPRCGDGIRTPGEVCFATPLTITSHDVAYSARFADMDRDGDQDIVYLIGDQIETQINANGTFAATAISGATAFGPSLVTLDYDADELDDLAVGGRNPADTNQTGVTLFRSDGTGKQTVAGFGASPLEPVAVGVGNIKGTGDMLVSIDANNVVLYTISSRGLLADGGTSVNAALHGAVGHVDDDAFADVVVGRTNGIVLYRGGAQGLSTIISTAVQTLVSAVAIGDVDGDGLADIAYVADGFLGYLPGAGAGAFFEPRMAPVSNPSEGFTLADVDGDGKHDLIVGNGSPNQIEVRLGMTAGLAAPINLPIAGSADQITTGDYNGDGAPDLLVTSTYSQTITVFPSNP